MKYVVNIAAGLLGLIFIMAGVTFLFNMIPPEAMPKLVEGTPAWHFDKAFTPTGYMKFVKILEVIGGILVAIPRTRNLGLLVLGPIIINIAAHALFINNGKGLFDPILIGICAIALFLLWAGRKEFGGLIRRPAKSNSAS
jgi:putative oxidoreductase